MIKVLQSKMGGESGERLLTPKRWEEMIFEMGFEMLVEF